MKFKIDENLPVVAAAILRDAGHLWIVERTGVRIRTSMPGGEKPR
jgi:hypothetical protein